MVRAWMQEPVRAGGRATPSGRAAGWPSRSGRAPRVRPRRCGSATAASAGPAATTRGMPSPASRPWASTAAPGAPTPARPTAARPARRGRPASPSPRSPLPGGSRSSGFPEARLRLAADRPAALVSARLCEVRADGASPLVTRALKPDPPRERRGHPSVLPGEGFAVRVRLDSIAHPFEAGSRIRVGVSPTYWPFAWPSPDRGRSSAGRRSALVLPVRDRPWMRRCPPSTRPRSRPAARRHARHRPAGRS